MGVDEEPEGGGAQLAEEGAAVPLQRIGEVCGGQCMPPAVCVCVCVCVCVRVCVCNVCVHSYHIPTFLYPQ